MTLDDIPSKPFVFHNEPSLNVQELNEKLNWIAYRLMRLTISFGEGLNGTEVDEYNRIFKEDKPKDDSSFINPKNGRLCGPPPKHKGLFLSD